MKVKIIVESTPIKLEESVNAFLKENPDIQVSSCVVNACALHEYWLNNNPVTIAQSWIDWTAVVQYEETPSPEFCSEKCKERYMNRRQAKIQPYCSHCEAPIKN